jgi:HPt (histidine-containing phosphotransfer) domain-containing protein
MSEQTNLPGENVGLDLTYLNDISGGNIEFMIEMIDIFLDQTPMYFDQLASAINASDWKSVAEVSHKIKPTFAFMGADKAREDIQEIEKNARQLDRLDTIPAKYALIKTACDHLFAQLKQHKTELETKL